MGVSLSLAPYLSPVGGGGSAAAPGMALATIPTPSGATVFRWNPGFSTVTQSSGRATQVTDLEGNANLTLPVGSAWSGPKVLTDALGRSFLRFEGSEYLDIAAGLATIQTRACAMFMVGRIHKKRSSGPLVSLGSWNQASQFNGGSALFRYVSPTDAAPTLGVGSLNSNGVNSGRAHMAVGSQLQVFGMVSRATANGGARFYMNNQQGTYTTAQQVTAVTSTTGGEVGRPPGTVAGGAEPALGTGAYFDLYDLYFVKGSITDAEAEAIIAGYQAEWQIPDVENYLIIEGDSISDGVAPLTSSENIAMLLTEPGAAHALPASWRVINMATSGNVVQNCVNRRDNANGPATFSLPGRNVVAPQIGRNDATAGGGSRTGAQIYSGSDGLANLVALFGAATVGYLARGYECVSVVNIAGSGNPPWITDLRALLRDITQFRADTGAVDGQDLRLADLPLILDGGGGTVFDTAADATDTTYYDADAVHPTAAGASAMVTGLSTAAYGLAARVLATS